jgi:CubicO group peptidase (beta-lactamase class C family)
MRCLPIVVVRFIVNCHPTRQRRENRRFQLKTETSDCVFLRERDLGRFGTAGGAGVLRSTTADLLKFAKANISIPNLPIGKAMADCQKEVYKGKMKKTDKEISMNLGWLNLKLDSIADTALFHNGGTGGFSTNLFIFKEKKTAFVVLFNSEAHSQEVAKARQSFMIDVMKGVMP